MRVTQALDRDPVEAVVLLGRPVHAAIPSAVRYVTIQVRFSTVLESTFARNEGTIPSVKLGRRIVIPREKFLALFAANEFGADV